MLKEVRLCALVCCALLFLPALSRGDAWAPAGEKIKTPWAEKIDVGNVLPEYPRPLLKRERWLNLNGLWEYAILPAGSEKPGKFDGKILVPFPVESSLSGVMKNVGHERELWYMRTFRVPKEWDKERVMLNFGGVDWKADVWLNGVKLGTHTGGYVPFSFEITNALKKGDNELLVRVWDPTDKSYVPRGKQSSNPRGIFYSSVSGIWQTVWIEPVGRAKVEKILITPDVDKKRLKVKVWADDSAALAKVELLEGGKKISEAKGISGAELDLPVEAPKLWSPDNPFLYELKIQLLSGGEVVDTVESYAAMRKVSAARSKDGYVRMRLNDREIYHIGPLDQGWWPDGLYTAPTDEALAFDIVKTKELGFNMIRKHVKVEPARWYYHCDRLGVLVWQDMPSGWDKLEKWHQWTYVEGEEEYNRTPESEANFRKEWNEIIDSLINHPCIVMWVPFNERWGQFKTKEIAEWTKSKDPTRLVNPASGGNFVRCGDVLDMHKYPEPSLYILDHDRVNVMGEYGGIGLPMEGHLWFDEKKNWGYLKLNSGEQVTDVYVSYIDRLVEISKYGICAGVYTQTTDVEGEVNGLITYDRKVIKVNADRVKQANKRLIDTLK